MAAEYDKQVVTSELNKLKKNELIDIILSFKLPVSVSNVQLINYVNSIKKCDNDCEFIASFDTVGHDECRNRACFKKKTDLQSEITSVKYNMETVSKLIFHLEKRTQEQEELIAFLKNNYSNPIVRETPSSNNEKKDSSSKLTRFNNPTIQGQQKTGSVKSVKHNQNSNDTKNVNITTKPTVDKHYTSENGNSQTINRKDVSLGIMEEQTRNTMNTIIGINNDVDKIHLSSTREEDKTWKKVEYGRSKTKSKKFNDRSSIIVGNNRNVSHDLKGVPKQVDLHVYRLSPNIDANILTSFLKDDFPEVTCSPLTSKHPELYSSFKVRIFEKHFKKAMDPALWPEDACIQRFLYLGKKIVGKQ